MDGFHYQTNTSRFMAEVLHINAKNQKIWSIASLQLKTMLPKWQESVCILDWRTHIVKDSSTNFVADNISQTDSNVEGLLGR